MLVQQLFVGAHLESNEHPEVRGLYSVSFSSIITQVQQAFPVACFETDEYHEVRQALSFVLSFCGSSKNYQEGVLSRAIYNEVRQALFFVLLLRWSRKHYLGHV